MVQAHHTLVTGDSGGGKTTLMREMYATYPGLSIWIDHNGVSGISGTDVDDAETVTSEAEARRSSATRIRWRTSDPLAAAGAARRVAHQYHERSGYPSQLIVDEAQDGILADGEVETGNPVKQALHQDRDHRLKVVVASQDPTDLEYTPLKQCQYFTWVGPWSTFHDGFIRYFSIPRDELPTEPYRWVSFDKRMNPIDSGTTKEEYA